MLTTVRQLQSTFPDIFDCEGREIRLDLIKRMLSNYHHRRRFASKRLRQLQLAEREKRMVVSVFVVYKFHINLISPIIDVLFSQPELLCKKRVELSRRFSLLSLNLPKWWIYPIYHLPMRRPARRLFLVESLPFRPPTGTSTSTTIHSSWPRRTKSHNSSTAAFHPWGIFDSVLSTMDARTRKIWSRFRPGQLTESHPFWARFPLMKVGNVNCQKWINLFCRTILSLISARLRTDSVEVNVWLNVNGELIWIVFHLSNFGWAAVSFELSILKYM